MDISTHHFHRPSSSPKMPPCTKFSILVNENSILPVAQVHTFGFSFNSPFIQYPSQVQNLPGATPRCGPCRFISLHPTLPPYSKHDSPCLHITNNPLKQLHCICSCPLVHSQNNPSGVCWHTSVAQSLKKASLLQ